MENPRKLRGNSRKDGIHSGIMVLPLLIDLFGKYHFRNDILILYSIIILFYARFYHFFYEIWDVGFLIPYIYSINIDYRSHCPRPNLWRF